MFCRKVIDPQPLARSSPRKAGTHTPCPLDGLRRMGPGSTAGTTQIYACRAERRMIGVLASVIDGVLVGAVYGLAAMGLTLIWGVMRVINLTHGAMIVLGMFIIYFLAKATGLSPYASMPIVVVVAFGVGVATYWIAVDRVIGRPVLMSLLATFACN